MMFASRGYFMARLTPGEEASSDSFERQVVTTPRSETRPAKPAREGAPSFASGAASGAAATMPAQLEPGAAGASAAGGIKAGATDAAAAAATAPRGTAQTARTVATARILAQKRHAATEAARTGSLRADIARYNAERGSGFDPAASTPRAVAAPLSIESPWESPPQAISNIYRSN